MFNTILESVQIKPKYNTISEDEAMKLIEYNNPWFSSDYHIFKEFRYDNGNWANNLEKDAKLHTNKIIKMHQKYVQPDDVFVFLGDLCESELNGRPDYQEKLINICNKLNGIKILIKGNNDMMPNEFYYKCGFVYVFDKPVYSTKYRCVFSHIPIDLDAEKLDKSFINIHGHLHGSRQYWNMDPSRHIDVYPEMNGNKPVKYSELIKNYENHLYDGITLHRQQLS